MLPAANQFLNQLLIGSDQNQMHSYTFELLVLFKQLAHISVEHRKCTHILGYAIVAFYFYFTNDDDDLLCRTITITWEFWQVYECNMTPSRANGVQHAATPLHSSL